MIKKQKQDKIVILCIAITAIVITCGGIYMLIDGIMLGVQYLSDPSPVFITIMVGMISCFSFIIGMLEGWVIWGEKKKYIE